MLRKIFISGLLLLVVSSLVYAAGSIVNVSVDKKEQTLIVEVSVDNKGAYLGCSIYTSRGRQDRDARFITGDDMARYKFPSDSTRYEVALWREKYKTGTGPDPDNAWGKINGYYLWNQLDRREGSL